MHRLSDIWINQNATVIKLTNCGDIRRRLQDIGIIKGTVIKCLGKSPLGDPTAYLIRGAVIAIRREDAEKILVERGRCDYGAY